MRVTQRQLRFLHELASLDNLNLGMLAPSARFSERHAESVARQCIERGWVRAEAFSLPWGRCLFLTTKGHRVLKRVGSRRRIQFNLPLGESAHV